MNFSNINIVKKYMNSALELNLDYYNRFVDGVNKNSDIFINSVKKFGTPQYILDDKILKTRLDNFMKIFKYHNPNSECFYAFKSNDLPYFIKKAKEYGYNADVAGKFELLLALKIGFKKIIFTSPGKNEDELLLALKYYKKVIINIDNIDEFETLSELIKKNKFRNVVRVSLRICTGKEISKEWSKFGIPTDDFLPITNKVSHHKHMDLVGLHFHSSWNKNPKKYEKNIEVIGDILNEVSARCKKTIKFIDIGGGFEPGMEGELVKSTTKGKLVELMNEINDKFENTIENCDFFVDDPENLELFSKSISSKLKSQIYSKFDNDIALFLEPGRYISKHTTNILTRVIAIKGDSAIVDVGQNNIGDDSLCSWEYAPIVNLSRPKTQRNKKTIYGATCDPHDILGYSYYGDGIRKGDILAILNQGAYTFSFARRFIKPIAPYVVNKENGQLVLAKKIETFHDRYRGCLI